MDPSSDPSSASSEAHVVLASEDRFGQAHSLGFSHIAFKTSTADTDGNLFVIEHSNLKPGGPPLHLHLMQEEWFYVMEGEVAFQVGDQRLQLRPGESVLAPRGVPHTFSSVGAAPRKPRARARSTKACAPASFPNRRTASSFAKRAKISEDVQGSMRASMSRTTSSRSGGSHDGQMYGLRSRTSSMTA